MNNEENTIRLRVSIDNSDLPKGLRDTEDQIGKSNKRLRDEQGRYIAGSKSAINDYGSHVSTTMGRSGMDANRLLNQYIGPAAMLAMGAAAGKALMDGFNDAINKAGKLQTEVAKSLSIKPNLDAKQFYKDLSELQTRVPKEAKEMAEAAYNVFSSLNVTQNEALQLVEKFSKGAVAASTDAKVWGTSVMGVMNAYKLTVQDVDHVQDVFFNTINAGVVEGNELANGLGNLTSAAKIAGVSIDEMGALLAGATKEGGDANQNMTYLADNLRKLNSKDAVKAMKELGVELVDGKDNFRPILDVLKDLQKQLDGMSENKKSKWLQAIFPDQQAQSSLIKLLSQLQFVEEQLKVNQTEAGSAGAAYLTMSQTYEVAAKLQENSMTRLQEAIGELIITHPAYIEAIKITSEQINGLTDSTMDAGSETAKFSNTVITEWSKIKVNLIPFLAFFHSLIKAFLYGLHTLVSGIIGGITYALESVVTVVINSFKEAINFAIKGINMVQSLAAKIAPDSALGQAGQIAEYGMDHKRVLRSDLPLASAKSAYSNFKQSLSDAGRYVSESNKAEMDIDKAVNAFNDPAAREERKRQSEERKRLDEERIITARRLSKEVEDRAKAMGDRTTAGGIGSPDDAKAKKAKAAPKITDDEDKFRLSEFKDVADRYKELTGRTLPTSAYGQSKTHNKMGLDHSNAADVPFNPSSSEGKLLINLLKQMDVPFRAITERDIANGVKATGPHIHVGEPSHAFGKNVKSLAANKDRNDNIQYIKDAQGNVTAVDMAKVQNTIATLRENTINRQVGVNAVPASGLRTGDWKNGVDPYEQFRASAGQQSSVTSLGNMGIKRQLNVDEMYRKPREDAQKERSTETLMRERNLAHEIGDVWRDVYEERKNQHMDTLVDIERTEKRLAGKIEDNANAEVVAARRLLMVRQEQESLVNRLAESQDRMATMSENSAQRMQVAYVEAHEKIQQASVNAYERMAEAQAKLEDQTVFHSEQMRAAVMDHAASAKSVTEIWSDAYTGAMDAIGDGVSRVIGKLTDKMGAFGDIINDIATNLIQMVTNRLMVKFLDHIMGGGSATSSSGAGGISGIGGVIMNAAGGGNAASQMTSGAFSGGGAGASAIMGVGIPTLTGPNGIGAGAFSRSFTNQAASQLTQQQVMSGAIQQAGTSAATAGVSGSAGAAGGMTASIASMLPLLGVSLGSSLGGPSRGGSIMGGVGGGLLGAAGGVALLGGSGASIFAAGGSLASLGGAAALLTNPFTIAAGVGLLIGAVIIGRNRQRRADETTRDGLAVTARDQVYELLRLAKAGELDVDQARASFDQIKKTYMDQANQIKDKKTRSHAILWWNDIQPVWNQIESAALGVKDKRSAAERLRPEFATGGVVAGALGSRQNIVAHAGEIIVNSMQQTPSVMSALNDAGVPNVRGAVARNGQPSGGGGGIVPQVNVNISLGKQDQTEITINGLKSDKGKAEVGRVMRNLRKDGE